MSYKEYQLLAQLDIRFQTQLATQLQRLVPNSTENEEFSIKFSTNFTKKLMKFTRAGKSGG